MRLTCLLGFLAAVRALPGSKLPCIEGNSLESVASCDGKRPPCIGRLVHARQPSGLQLLAGERLANVPGRQGSCWAGLPHEAIATLFRGPWANKTVIFDGDSIMEHQWAATMCALKAHRGWGRRSADVHTAEVRTPPAWVQMLPAPTYSRFPSSPSHPTCASQGRHARRQLQHRLRRPARPSLPAPALASPPAPVPATSPPGWRSLSRPPRPLSPGRATEYSHRRDYFPGAPRTRRRGRFRVAASTTTRGARPLSQASRTSPRIYADWCPSFPPGRPRGSSVLLKEVSAQHWFRGKGRRL
jgi:hypothetical protein